MKIIHKALLAIHIIFLCLLAISCKSESIVSPSGDLTNPEVVKSILNNAIKQWDTSCEYIISNMTGYIQVSGTQDDFLQYISTNGETSISYQFNNGKLCATLVLMPTTTNVHDLQSYINGYTYVGELDGGSVYENLTCNTLATIWQPTEYNNEYCAIGFAPIKYNFDSIQPASVTTITEPKVEGFYAILSAKVTGTDKDVEAGFLYGRTPYLSESSGMKIKTTTHGTYTLKAIGLIDEETYYYCPYVVIDDICYLGSVNSFETGQITYSINGKIFKMIKVEGGSMPEFSMMQTEIIPSSGITIGNEAFDKLDSNGDKIITKADLRKFINNLNEKTGLKFRLPTPNEWMYAASGGNKTQGFIYSGSNNIDDVAWYSGNSSNMAHDIALKSPNELGFFDMSGNYGEICSTEEYDVDGNHYGGSWKKTAANCKITSYITDSKDSGYISGSNIHNKNATDVSDATIRLVYSRNEE